MPFAMSRAALTKRYCQFVQEDLSELEAMMDRVTVRLAVGNGNLHLRNVEAFIGDGAESQPLAATTRVVCRDYSLAMVVARKPEGVHAHSKGHQPQKTNGHESCSIPNSKFQS